jgi:hypothetical protein
MDVKQAVQLAKGTVQELFGDQICSDPLLEEVEHAESGAVWLITIGFLRRPDVSITEPASGRSGLFDIPRRAYKVVRINDGTGQVMSVKDREFA